MLFEDDKFARAAIRKSNEKTSAHDASIIKNNKIARFKKIGNVGIVAVGDFAGLFIENEQASSATNFGRTLGDILFRQIVIKI